MKSFESVNILIFRFVYGNVNLKLNQLGVFVSLLGLIPIFFRILFDFVTPCINKYIYKNK